MLWISAKRRGRSFGQMATDEMPHETHARDHSRPAPTARPNDAARPRPWEPDARAPADHHQDRFNQSIARSYERSDRNLAEEPFRCAAGNTQL